MLSSSASLQAGAGPGRAGDGDGPGADRVIDQHVHVDEQILGRQHGRWPLQDSRLDTHLSLAEATSRQDRTGINPHNAPQGEEDESGIPLHEGKSLWTARVNARSSVRTGDRIELAVDTSNMHFFDPDSGLTIGSKKIAGSRSVTSKRQSPDAEDMASPKLAS
jgi:hypothetical protein